mmetsp:Transcript_51703/g.121298  ORF Transcript_51703/g.121298 Transcript_51703/m.121298 type:complete len:209 (+) Transcript_51703:119-745(+)
MVHAAPHTVDVGGQRGHRGEPLCFFEEAPFDGPLLRLPAPVTQRLVLLPNRRRLQQKELNKDLHAEQHVLDRDDYPDVILFAGVGEQKLNAVVRHTCEIDICEESAEGDEVQNTDPRTDVVHSGTNGTAKLRHHLERIRPHLDEVVNHGECGGERESRGEHDDVAILQNELVVVVEETGELEAVVDVGDELWVAHRLYGLELCPRPIG